MMVLVAVFYSSFEKVFLTRKCYAKHFTTRASSFVYIPPTQSTSCQQILCNVCNCCSGACLEFIYTLFGCTPGLSHSQENAGATQLVLLLLSKDPGNSRLNSHTEMAAK
jgi:hypothetical protein